MEWLVSYTRGGEVRHMRMNVRTIPNIKAIAFSIYSLEFPGCPRPSIASSAAETWLEACDIQLTDVRLLSRTSLQSEPPHYRTG